MTEYFKGLSGVQIPKIIYGTAWKKDKTADLVELALARGFRGIDTACQPKHYKEPLVGEGIKRAYDKGLKREDLFIQTKFTGFNGQDPNDCPYDPNLEIKDQVKASIAVSLKNLHTDQLDSWVLHGPYVEWQDTLSAWRAMEGFAAEGKTKQIGMSNCYDLKMFKTLFSQAEIKPAVLQNRFYLEQNYDKELRDFCNEKGVYYQSFWTLKVNPNILQSPVVSELAQLKSKTPQQIFSKCLHHYKVHPLFGTTSQRHMDEVLDLSSFTLTDVECELIRKTGPF